MPRAVGSQVIRNLNALCITCYRCFLHLTPECENVEGLQTLFWLQQSRMAQQPAAFYQLAGRWRFLCSVQGWRPVQCTITVKVYCAVHQMPWSSLKQFAG